MRHLPRDERCDVSRRCIGFECFVIRGESAVKSSVDDTQIKKSYIYGDQTTGNVTNVFMSAIEILHKATARHTTGTRTQNLRTETPFSYPSGGNTGSYRERMTAIRKPFLPACRLCPIDEPVSYVTVSKHVPRICRIVLDLLA